MCVRISNILFVYFTLIFDGAIKVDDVVSQNKVHVAVGAHVIYQELIVEKYWISIVLVASVRIDLPDDL